MPGGCAKKATGGPPVSARADHNRQRRWNRKRLMAQVEADRVAHEMAQMSKTMDHGRRVLPMLVELFDVGLDRKESRQ